MRFAHVPNGYRALPAWSASAADRVADGYLAAAITNGHLRRLVSRDLEAYRSSMVTFLAASCDRSPEVRAASLLGEAHQDRSVTASDYELVGYYLLAAAERCELPVVTQATIAGAFRQARPLVVPRSAR